MGRPRKRPRDETDEAPADAAADDTPATKNIMTELPPTTTDPGMDFINFLTADFALNYQEHSHPIDAMRDAQDKGTPWRFGFTGDALADLNFDAGSPPQPQQQQQEPSYTASSNIDPALFASSITLTDPSPPSSEQVPGLSPPSATASTPESSASSAAAAAPPPCACTASLYLALDSMQKLAPTVTDGVRQARHASRTAYQVVNCPACAMSFDPPGHPQHQPPSAMRIHNFQNLMLLGTLIPSIVHAYERILAAVDRETAHAQRERRQLVFQLTGLGGVWGPLGEDVAGPCGASHAFDHRDMEPAMWRLTVRALLKLDVYGLYSDGTCNVGNGGPDDALHLGLRDIVTMMENRSRARHAMMDAMILSGAWPDPPCSLKLYSPGEQPTCQQIIAIAKRSVEQLVIA